MSIAAVKTYNLRRIIVALVSSVGTAMIFSGCTAKLTWETYHNPRYGFEFPYPSNWNTDVAPDNNDGVTFISPHNQNTEIRSWVTKELPELQNPETIQQTDHNFETAQGVSGVLVVDVGQQISSMKLTITQGQEVYYWQGQTNSQEFKDYYQLFYYIAQHYKIRLETSKQKISHR